MPINPIAQERAAELAQASAQAQVMFHFWLLLVVIGVVVYAFHCRWYRRDRVKRDKAFRAEWERHDQQQKEVKAG